MTDDDVDECTKKLWKKIVESLEKHLDPVIMKEVRELREEISALKAEVAQLSLQIRQAFGPESMIPTSFCTDGMPQMADWKARGMKNEMGEK